MDKLQNSSDKQIGVAPEHDDQMSIDTDTTFCSELERRWPRRTRRQTMFFRPISDEIRKIENEVNNITQAYCKSSNETKPSELLNKVKHIKPKYPADKEVISELIKKLEEFVILDSQESVCTSNSDYDKKVIDNNTFESFMSNHTELDLDYSLIDSDDDTYFELDTLNSYLANSTASPEKQIQTPAEISLNTQISTTVNNSITQISGSNGGGTTKKLIKGKCGKKKLTKVSVTPDKTQYVIHDFFKGTDNNDISPMNTSDNTMNHKEDTKAEHMDSSPTVNDIEMLCTEIKRNGKQTNLERAVSVMETAKENFLLRLKAEKQKCLQKSATLSNKKETSLFVDSKSEGNENLQLSSNFTLSEDEKLQNMALLHEASGYYENMYKNNRLNEQNFNLFY